MDKQTLKKSTLLTITAIIWGFAFVAQDYGADILGPFFFNSIRVMIGSLVVLALIKLFDRYHPDVNKPKDKDDYKKIIKAGILTGISLFFASSFQQLGIYYGSSVGKAGFLTATYIVLVPIINYLFFKKKSSKYIVLAVVLTLLGLYLLCVGDSLALEWSDVLTLLGALCFAIQILLIDYFAPHLDKMRFAFVEFLTCGLLGIIPILLFEKSGLVIFRSNFSNITMWISLLYASILSTGVAYSLQIICQSGLNPTLASMIMSSESVFSAIGGFLLLNQTFSVKELIGCAIIFVAILIAEVRGDK